MHELVEIMHELVEIMHEHGSSWTIGAQKPCITGW